MGDGCLSCDLQSGARDLPGGTIHSTEHWCVQHCVGPFPLGSLIVAPRRHVGHVWDFTIEEADELGPLLAQAARAVRHVCRPEQAYVSLWTHSPDGNWHAHFLIQPIEAPPPDGPRAAHLQAQFFDRDVTPDPEDIDGISDRMRDAFRIDMSGS